jgi:hypothetical protein
MSQQGHSSIDVGKREYGGMSSVQMDIHRYSRGTNCLSSRQTNADGKWRLLGCYAIWVL